MQKKKLFQLGFTGMVLVASLLLLASDKPAKVVAPPAKEKKPTCCTKMNIQTCPAKTPGAAPGEMILDNLSSQFISISAFY